MSSSDRVDPCIPPRFCRRAQPGEIWSGHTLPYSMFPRHGQLARDTFTGITIHMPTYPVAARGSCYSIVVRCVPVVV